MLAPACLRAGLHPLDIVFVDDADLSPIVLVPLSKPLSHLGNGAAIEFDGLDLSHTVSPSRPPGRTLNGRPLRCPAQPSGPGLAPEGLERLFEAFYTTKPGGLGMGLSICRTIIEAHQGRLWASANVPRGAVLQFTVPASPDTGS